MIRFILILVLLLPVVNARAVNAQDTCYLGTWELDAAYTFSDANLSSFGGAGDAPVEFSQATGSAYLTFGNDGDFTYTFDNWSVTFRGDLGGMDMDTQINMHGDVWGRYVPGPDNSLTMFMSGEGVPAPNVESSLSITAGGFSMGEQEIGIGSFFGPQNFALIYRCEGNALYVDGESAGGTFKNGRYLRP